MNEPDFYPTKIRRDFFDIALKRIADDFGFICDPRKSEAGSHGVVGFIEGQNKVLKITNLVEATIFERLLKAQDKVEAPLWPYVYSVFQIDFEYDTPDKYEECTLYAVIRENVADLEDVDAEEGFEIDAMVDCFPYPIDLNDKEIFKELIEANKLPETHIRDGYWESVEKSFNQIREHANAIVYDYICANVGINSKKEIVIRDLSAASIIDDIKPNFHRIKIRYNPEYDISDDAKIFDPYVYEPK